jgi:hypothetical protein
MRAMPIDPSEMKQTRETGAEGGQGPSLSRHERLPVGVVVERRAANSRREDVVWLPVAVIPGAPATAAWTLLREEGAVAQYFAGVSELELIVRETPNYLLNLSTERPSVYVVLQPGAGDGPFGVSLRVATVSPSEAEAYMDGAHVIERVPMPEVIAAWIADYCAIYHVEEKFWKRRRKPHDANKGFGRGSDSNDYGPSSSGQSSDEKV